jgi:hypothetical protein
VARQIGAKSETRRVCNPSPWCWYRRGNCSATCEGVRRSRSISCERIGDDGSWILIPLDACLNDSTITGGTPVSDEDCGTESCLKNCTWRAGEYGDCSQTCDGTQRRVISCICSVPDGSPATGNRSDCERDDPRLRPIESRSCGVECANYSWIIGNWTSCSSFCSAGTRNRDVVCRKEIGGRILPSSQRDCLDPIVVAQVGSRPTTQERCDLQCSYYIGEWSQCSVSCGGGTQTRLVTCLQNEEDGSTRTVDISHCEADNSPDSPRPLGLRDCNAEECGVYRWRAGTYGECSRTCEGTQIRKVFCAYVYSSGHYEPVEQNVSCIQNNSLEIPVGRQSCGGLCPTFGWVTEAYGECSAICGPGTQTRVVYCSRTTDSLRVRVGDDDCSFAGLKPRESKPCSPEPRCAYDGLQWSGCSVTCGSGTRRRDVECYRLIPGGGRRLVFLQHCRFDPTLQEPFPPSTREVCDTGIECVDYKWVVGEWSRCSPVCGPGSQFRSVNCTKVILSGSRSGFVSLVEDNDCVRAGLGSKRHTTRVCDPLASCRYDVGFWSRCPVTCGTGLETRRVDCLRRVRFLVDEVVDLIHCLNDSSITQQLPVTERLCSTESCPLPPVIRFVSSSAPPPPPNRDLNYAVRQDVHVIKGRTLTIDCVEIQAMPEPRIRWRLQNGAILQPGYHIDRFKMTENATLVISDVSLRDEGLYTCTATNIVGRDIAYSPVTVYEPPQITYTERRVNGFPASLEEPGESVPSRPNDEVLLTCRAFIGKPPPDVTWYRRGRNVTGIDRISILPDGTLRLSNVQLDDEDNYTCTATNIVGTTSSVIWLAVTEYESHWVVVVGNCSTTCGGGSRVVSSECRRKSDDRLLSKEDCVGQRRPTIVRERCAEIPCPGRWVANKFGPCSGTCEGLQSRTVNCRQQRANGEFVIVADDICLRDDPNVKPRTNQPCGPECSEYTWNRTQWSPCSMECRYGLQKRIVACIKYSGASLVQEEDSVCTRRLGPKPTEERDCEPVPDCRYSISEWSACSVSCESGVRTRTVYCIKTENDVQRTIAPDHCARDVTLSTSTPRTKESCYLRKCPCTSPRWIESSLSTCSVSCGGGTQTRDFVCYCRLNGRLQPAQSVDICRSVPKPATTLRCGEERCPCERYRWRRGGWKDCSVSCGSGVERRQISCICTREGKEEVTEDELGCLIYDRPSTERNCYRLPCPCANPRWQPGNWTGCSATCNGRQRRDVKCICGGKIVEDGVCIQRVVGQSRPSEDRECGGLCPCINYRYSESDWTACSRTCGDGTQTRSLSCLCDLEGRKKVKPVTECEAVIARSRPEGTRSCYIMRCPCVGPYYVTGPWSVCPRPCGGIQTRQLECRCLIERIDTFVMEEECRYAGLSRPESSKKCTPCRYGWVSSKWKRCTGTCTRRRTVYCSDQHGNRVSDSVCYEHADHDKPFTKERCIYNGTKEKIVWSVSGWSRVRNSF